MSVTVPVTVNVPAPLYVCDALPLFATVPSPKSILELAIVPSGSLDPAVEAVTDKGAVPELGVTVSFATGGLLPVAEETATFAVATDEAPLLSITVAVTMNPPALVYVCDALPLFATVPSPKSILELAIVPSGSLDPAVDAVTVKGAAPELGLTDNFATGDWFAGNGSFDLLPAPQVFSTATVTTRTAKSEYRLKRIINHRSSVPRVQPALYGR